MAAGSLLAAINDFPDLTNERASTSEPGERCDVTSAQCNVCKFVRFVDSSVPSMRARCRAFSRVW